MDTVQIGVIGGSGLYDIPELTDIEEHQIETPFGAPSDAIRVGTLAGTRVAFVARHGRGHVYTPSEVPYRANIYALKTLGVQRVIAVSACGSLRERMAPGHVVVPDQLVDWTKDNRGRTFFGNGLVAHVGPADPFCPELNIVLADAVAQVGGTVHRGGTYVTIEGPRFSTRAESALFRQWGCDIIGMTTSPEAYLAREAEMCYAVMAHVTDYDVWHESGDVTVEMVVQTLNANLHLAQQVLVKVVERLTNSTPPEVCGCQSALSSALMTDPKAIPEKTLNALWPIVGKYYSD